MSKVKVSIVHDELGNIKSISRPANDRVIVLSGVGETVLETEVDEKSIGRLIADHRIDVQRRSLVRAGDDKAAK